jgi:hypothetical protein
LRAIAHFLDRMGLAHFADQFINLAQKLQDESRRIPTRVQLGRAHIALAVETLRGPDGNRTSRKSAAKWAAKRYPGLKQLIIEKPPPRSDEERHRSDDIETAIISWCEDFRSDKVENDYAKRVYAVGLSKLKAWAPNCNDAQLEAEADRLLQEALRFCSDTV